MPEACVAKTEMKAPALLDASIKDLGREVMRTKELIYRLHGILFVPRLESEDCEKAGAENKITSVLDFTRNELFEANDSLLNICIELEEVVGQIKIL